MSQLHVDGENRATDARVIGRSQPRLEGRQRVTGATSFTGDIVWPGVKHVQLLLSPIASAKIISIDLRRAQAAPGVLAVESGATIGYAGPEGPDAPLAMSSVSYVGQPLAAVVADTEGHAADAVQLIDIELDTLDPVLEPEAALATGTRAVLDGVVNQGMDDAGAHGVAVGTPSEHAMNPNVSQYVAFKEGNVTAALREAAVRIEGRYELPAVHQGFLEPHVVIATPEADGRISIHTPTQGAFFTRREVARVLRIPLASIRVVPMPVGGGFGGKLCLLEPLIVLLVKKVGLPVRLELTRTAEFLMGRGGPGCVIDLTLGADGGGNLTALLAKVIFDHGAGRGALGGLAGLLLGGTYRLPAYEIECFDIVTNKTPAAAYRAPGAPQAYFALESAMDELARRQGRDPIDLRIQNGVREGDPRPDGKSWPRIGLLECLEAARQHPAYRSERQRGEGVGIAVGAWGGGLEPAAAACRVDADGSLVVQLGTSDISGTNTTLAMIAAETFGVELNDVRIEVGDTSSSPYAGVSGGSKTILTVGLAVQKAAAEARRQLLEIAADVLEAAPPDLEVIGGRVSVRGMRSRAVPVAEIAGLALQFGGRYEPIEARGASAVVDQAPMFTVHIARVNVDEQTGDWKLTDLTAIQDVGRALNPAEIEGQIHGGALQGAGRALGESLVWSDSGQLLTSTFIDYGMPSIDQAPAIAVQLVEVPSEQGPFGARGVGEPPAVPGPAAIANAIRSATGIRVTRLPIETSQLVAVSSRSEAGISLAPDQTTRLS